jgi:hypothetical protein
MAAVTLRLVPESRERIIGAGGPALRVERRLRYEIVADLVRGSALWCDLGCGDGVDIAATLGERPAPRALLVDADADTLERAQRELPADGVETLRADLGDAAGVDALTAALSERSGDGPVTITCFDCLEYLTSFVPLVSALVDLAERGGATVVLSAPNDAFWSIDDARRPTVWGEGAFDELRTLLPPDHVLLRQVVLQGSALVRAGADPDLRPAAVELDPDGVPSHLLAAFGPERERVGAWAGVAQIDMEEQRRWERQRDADLALLEDYEAAARTDGDRPNEPA